jgi:hypothetical protein
MDKKQLSSPMNTCEGLGMHAEIVMIGDGLMSLADGLPMCHVTCQHNHVVVKGKLSRCSLKIGWCGEYCSLPTVEVQVQGAHVECQPMS